MPAAYPTVTGSDDTFSFRNLEEGNCTLTITKEGYKQNSQTVTVRLGDPTSAHMLIERIPTVVTADREVLDFGDNASTNTLSFSIVNPGYVDLAWEIEERCAWIACNNSKDWEQSSILASIQERIAWDLKRLNAIIERFDNRNRTYIDDVIAAFTIQSQSFFDFCGL